MQDGLGLCSEVFNFIPGTVNKQWGAAWYDSQDQAFSFHKQVRFENVTGSPDLDPNVSSSQAPKALTPYHGSSNLNCTFKVSQISPFRSGTQQDAATIAAEVSAAAAAQASKEFHHMCEPKITKLKGGYLVHVELVFHSWCMDILTHIKDHELDNVATIQLIKEQTQDSTHWEVEFQLDLCGGDIDYQDLLKHLSITFQGGQ